MSEDRRRRGLRIVRCAALCALFAILLSAPSVGADDPALDCIELNHDMQTRCTELRYEAMHLNCWESYKGCSDDVVRCRIPSWNITFSHLTGLCDSADYLTCVLPARDDYLACLRACNERVAAADTDAQRAPILETCGDDCFAVLEANVLACGNSTCGDWCISQGYDGGVFTHPLDQHGCRCFNDPTAPSEPADSTTPGETGTEGSPSSEAGSEDASGGVSEEGSASDTGAPNEGSETTAVKGQGSGNESAAPDADAASSGSSAESTGSASPDADVASSADSADSSTGASSGADASSSGADASSSSSEALRPKCHSFRIRPVSAWSVGEIVGYTRVTYEIQEILDDGTTGRRCRIQFSGWGLTAGLPINANFSPGYQWTTFDTAKGRMRLEDFDGVKGYHASGGALVYGVGGCTFGDADSTWNKQGQSSGSSWSVGPFLGLDWMFGTWKIVEPPK